MILPAAASSARRRLLIPVALLVPVLLSGCSGRPAPLARVGSEVITVEQFQDAARGNEMQYQGVPDSAKAALIEDLVRRSLLVQEAKRRHLVPDSTLDRLRKQEADRASVDVLIQRLVPKDAPVSDAEIETFYKQRTVQARMSLVFTLTRSEIDQAKAALDRGEDFAAVANRFNVPGMIPPGGDLGFQPPGALIEPLDQYLFDAPIGKVQGPVEVEGQGWVIAKVAERKPREQESLDAQKATLRTMIRQRKQRALQQSAFLNLKQQYRIRVEAGAGQAMFQRFNTQNEALMRGMGQSVPPPADSADAGRVLARYDGEGGKATTYTMADALHDLQEPGQQRPNLSSVPVIERWIELEALRRVSSIEARRRHIDQEPEVRRRIEQRVNNLLLERIYADEVAGKVGAADETDVRAVYERRSEALSQVNAVKLLTLTLPDSASANALIEHAGHGTTPDLHQLAAMLPAKLKATAKVVARDVRFPTKDPQWTQLQPLFTGMSPNDLRGPMKTPGGWMFFQLVSKEQAPQPFEKLPPALQHALQQEALETKRDRRLSQFTDSLRSAAKIEIFRDRLKKIPWPVPAPAAQS